MRGRYHHARRSRFSAGGWEPPSEFSAVDPPDGVDLWIYEVLRCFRGLTAAQPTARRAGRVWRPRCGDLSPLGLRLCCLVLAGRCAAAAASAGSGLVGQR